MRNKKDALAMAVKLLNEPRAEARDNPKAISGTERAKLMAERAVMKSRQAEIEAELKTIGNGVRDGSELLTAAEFVADVDGDEPSIPQLREAAKSRRRFVDLKAESNDLFNKIRNQPIYAVRCEIVRKEGIGISVIAQGDTWEDVCVRIEAKASRHIDQGLS